MNGQDYTPGTLEIILISLISIRCGHSLCSVLPSQLQFCELHALAGLGLINAGLRRVSELSWKELEGYSSLTAAAGTNERCGWEIIRRNPSWRVPGNLNNGGGLIKGSIVIQTMIYSYQRTKLARNRPTTHCLVLDFSSDTCSSSLITGQDLHYAKDQPDIDSSRK